MTDYTPGPAVMALMMKRINALPQWRGGPDQVGYRDDFDRTPPQKRQPAKAKIDKRAEAWGQANLAETQAYISAARAALENSHD